MMKASSLPRNGSPPKPQIQNTMEKKSTKRSKDRERRWTTGLERGQLQLPYNGDDVLLVDDTTMTLSQDMSSVPSVGSLSSWGSTLSDLDSTLEFQLRSPTPTPDHSSQQDIFQELLYLNKSILPDQISNHQYQLSYELAVDTSPLSPSNYGPSSQQVAHCYHVILELNTTERRYVHDLTDIIEGYYVPLSAKIGYYNVSESDLQKLFGNIEEVKEMHRSLKTALELSGRDLLKIGQCFIDKAEDFKMTYSQYCVNYPLLVETYAKLSKDKPISRFLKVCQQRLHHPLPLGAYLLKPVQRVLKYSLLLIELVKHMNSPDSGYREMQMAVKQMTEVAEHINAMKKRYDAAVHTQEVQSLLNGWEGVELKKYGDIVLEDVFRVVFSKSGTFRPSSSALRSAKEMYVFLFQKMLLITSKKKDESYFYRHHVEITDLQLTEHLKEPACFQIRQISNKGALTFQARCIEQKQEWGMKIKQLLMESLPNLPDKAKQLIREGFTTDVRRTYSSPSMTLDRKLSKQENSQVGGSTFPHPLKNSQKLPVSQPKRTQIQSYKGPTNQKPSSSLLQAGLTTGFFFGVPGQSNGSKDQKTEGSDSGLSESPLADSDNSTKRKQKTRFGSLPHDIFGSPWTRSDSDPSLQDRYMNDREILDTNISSSVTSSPLYTHYGNKLEQSFQRTSPDRSSATTPTNLDIQKNFHSTMSSPDLELSSPMSLNKTLTGTDSEIERKETTDKNGVNSSVHSYHQDGDLDSANMSPVSPNPSDKLNDTSFEDQLSASLGMLTNTYLKPRSSPYGMHEPVLETIFSVDNTPRNSFAGDNLPLLVTDRKVTTSPLKIVQSLKSKGSDVIDIKSAQPVPQSSESDEDLSHNNGAVLDPPSMFADQTTSERVTQYTLNTNNTQDESECDKNELLFQELMGNSGEYSTQYESTLREILSQPQEDDTEDVMEKHRGSSLPHIMVEPPASFQVHSPVTSDEETPVSSPPAMSLGLISPDDIPSVRSSYERQTTPYTSIEDIPGQCELERQLSSDEIGPSASPTPSESRKNLNFLKRWHSFQSGHNRIIRDQTDVKMTDNSSPKKEKKEKLSRSDSNKLSFLRTRRFSKSKPKQRPISVIGLVHSTRDDSDLVDLDDALILSKRMNCITPDIIVAPPLEFQDDKPVRGDEIQIPTLSVDVNKKSYLDDEEYIRFCQSLNLPPESSPHTTSTSDDSPSPATKKQNRWSLLRSKLSNPSKKTNDSSSPTSEEDSSSSTNVHVRTHPEKVPEERSGSLFNIDSRDTRRRNKFSKEKRRLTEEDNSGCSTPTLQDPSGKRMTTRVQMLARDYSQRIKKQSSSSPIPSLSKEEESIASQLSSTSTESPAATPTWLQALKDRRKQYSSTHSRLHDIQTRNTCDDQVATTDDDNLSPLLTPTPDVLGLESPLLTPTSDIFESTLTSSQSFTMGERDTTETKTDPTFSPPLSLKKTVYSNFQRFSSESGLAENEKKEKTLMVTNSKKKPGWVKSLVHKFSTSK